MPESQSNRLVNSRRNFRAAEKSSGLINPAIGSTHTRLIVKGPSSVYDGVILALKEHRNYNIHETDTGRIRASGMFCDCVPSQRKDVHA